MKSVKKIITLLLAFLIIISSSAIVSNASESSVFVNNFNPLLRYWHYGSYPDKVTYSSGGYATLESTHYEQQHQVCFYGQPIKDQWNNLIKEAVNNYDSIVGFDIHVKDCYGTNKFDSTDGTGHEQSAPGFNVIIKYKYKDNSGKTIEDELLNFEAPVGQVGIGKTKHFIFPIDEDYTKYDSFEITFVKISVINYACLANENGEQGCGDLNVSFSPFYIEGTPAPEIGTDLGENFNPSLYSWESTDKVTSISQGNLTPDGPLYGGVDLKRNDSYLPYLADGVTVATLNGNNKPVTTTVTPTNNNRQCSHIVTTSKITKKATYFENGVNTVYCAICNKALNSTTIPKKVLSKPSIKVSAKKKSAKITWKKIKDATGYVVEMKNGKKFKRIKTINKGKTIKFTKKGLKKGKKYSFRVKALLKLGSKKCFSNYSSTKTVKAK